MTWMAMRVHCAVCMFFSTKLLTSQKQRMKVALESSTHKKKINERMFHIIDIHKFSSTLHHLI